VYGDHNIRALALGFFVTPSDRGRLLPCIAGQDAPETGGKLRQGGDKERGFHKLKGSLVLVLFAVHRAGIKHSCASGVLPVACV
jgi:hypothetical protein